MTDTTKVLEAKDTQRKQAKRATFESLSAKKRSEREFTVKLAEGADPVSVLFRAIGATEYDKLLTRHPPTKDQLADGNSFDINTFGPALLSKVCVEPGMDNAQWTEIWNSPDWNRGEVLELFTNAVDLCNRGLDLTPIVAG